METIVISGANRGIGLELAKQFLNAGNRVIAGCRNPANATALRALAGNNLLTILPLDVAVTQSITTFCQQLSHETIAVLINNAGVMGGDKQGMHDMDYAAWATTLAINTFAPFQLATALLPNLKRTQRPRIVTLSSQMGAFNLPMHPGTYAYRSSKTAVSKVMQVLAWELKSEGVIVCPVHPGWVRTDMGGEKADISAAESAAGLFNLINSMTMEHSGRFWTWQGIEHPW